MRPDPRLLDAARRLAALADFLVITSNGAHVFQGDIEAASGLRVLSMIDGTLAELRRRGWTRVGVLGLGEPVVYTRPLATLGVAFETVDGATQSPLDAAIFRTMEGRDEDGHAAAARAAVARLRERGVDGIILDCTELPLLLRDAADAPDLINPSELLAERAVRFSLDGFDGPG